MRALVIEDDPVSAKLIETALRTENIVFEPTDRGEEGIELAKLYDFDIIILDLRLPDIDGYEVVRRLRASRVQTPVLILSGRSDPTDKVRGLTNGADDYLKKPFSRDEICTVAMKSLKPWHINAGKRRIIPSMKKTITLDLLSTPDVIDPVFYHVFDDAASLGFPEDALRLNVYLALNEALANAMDHGHKGDPEKIIRFEAHFTSDEVEILVRDEGEGFDPEMLPDPTDPENLMRTRGRGVFLMRCYMDEVEYRDGGRTLRLVKRRPEVAGVRPGPPED